jgi:hypothetical protein
VSTIAIKSSRLGSGLPGSSEIRFLAMCAIPAADDTAIQNSIICLAGGALPSAAGT